MVICFGNTDLAALRREQNKPLEQKNFVLENQQKQ